MTHRDTPISTSKSKADLIKRFDSLAKDRLRWKERNKYYYDDQLRHFQFLVPEGSSILELGCGTGELLAALRPRRGLGVDFSAEMVKLASERNPEMEFLQADIEELANWGETFDVLIMTDVIGHLHDIQETLQKLRSFCRDETRIILSYYNFLWEPILKIGEWLGLKMPQGYQNWLSTEDICNLLTLSGFQVVKTETRLLLPKRIPFLSDWINRYFATFEAKGASL